MQLRRTAASAVIAIVSVVGLTSPASADSVDDAKAALGAADSNTAAQIIRDNGYATRPDVLGDILVGSGNIAVQDGYGDQVGQAIADAFVAGGVNPVTAQLAFAEGVSLVAAQAASNPQILRLLAPGGLAVLRTELAYLGLRLPELPVSALPLPLLPLPLQPR